ncbi:MAG: transcription elongation factor GreA [Candidatus Daviesbacteria bacterium]|nr:transcription elongation factor GreA [Candidatus Daviesbacteria bacterium]
MAGAKQQLTRNGQNTYITAKGLADAKVELEFLKKTRRVQIAEKIHQAREYGDLTENSEYDAALEEQAMAESRISDLEDILKSAKVIENQHNQDFVVIGSTVKIEMDEGIDEFTIVGRVEADPSKKRISNESPLGLALVGAKKGETVEVTTPIVRYKCKVLEIK